MFWKDKNRTPGKKSLGTAARGDQERGHPVKEKPSCGTKKENEP